MEAEKGTASNLQFAVLVLTLGLAIDLTLGSVVANYTLHSSRIGPTLILVEEEECDGYDDTNFVKSG